MATEEDIEENQEIEESREPHNTAAEFSLLEEVRETRTLKVSARGRGLCLYLPKDLTEVHGVVSGDRLKVQFREHYRLQAPECDSLSKLYN